MRAVVATVVVMTCLTANFHVALAEPIEPPAEETGLSSPLITASGNGTLINVGGYQGFTRPGSRQPEGPDGSAQRVVSPELLGLVLVSGTTADGAVCTELGRDVFDSRQAAASVSAVTLGAVTATGMPAGCPVGTVQVSPELVALSFWEQADLPAPAPHIAPGWMITGMRAYLEANTSTTAHFEYDTPFGLLVIDARAAELVVDWGDGTGRERYESLGGPWPDGDVVHIYADKGSVDVTATQDWTATWTLGGASGTLDGMQTTGNIDNLQLRELEAVLD